ncbi:MAG: hypothetical protein KKB81_00645 [Candidatus Margulisbacteria bacterium]|nr:hypothetical protein [Candidatus Margulisiibacteriota bacterium]MBU1021486.1 hypothetical protein [Candidatus Margulisiibacteriota bacterium]MBU1728571.1 hypothetical protein [Candidatus Margulisiibacteriota bacterium]MBU1955850.1 hypothetical protein [Candidatus Margulisiibacteriota bacterium]
MQNFGALNPLSNLGPALAKQALVQQHSSEDAQKQFVAIFVKEILAQSFAKASSIGSTDNKNNKSMFPDFDSTMYNEMLVEQVGEELINSGAFNVDKLMPSTQSNNWRGIINQAKQSWLM